MRYRKIIPLIESLPSVLYKCIHKLCNEGLQPSYRSTLDDHSRSSANPLWWRRVRITPTVIRFALKSYCSWGHILKVLWIFSFPPRISFVCRSGFSSEKFVIYIISPGNSTTRSREVIVHHQVLRKWMKIDKHKTCPKLRTHRSPAHVSLSVARFGLVTRSYSNILRK